MMLPQVRYIFPEIFVVVRWFSQKLQAHKLNMIKLADTLVTIIATLHWASCGPGTGLQALKSQYRFGKKSLLTNCTKATKNIRGKLHLPFLDTRVGVKYFSKYLSQVQVLFHIYKFKYKFKYSEYLEDIKYIKYFFNQVQVKYKYFGNKGLRAPPLMDYAINHRISYRNTESLLSTLIVTDHQCYRAIKSLQTTVHSNTIDTYNTGPRITSVIATRRKNFSQRERSFLWKLRCQWPKPPRRAAKTPATQDPGAHVTNAKRPLTKSPQQKARLWLADAKASPNHSQAPRQKLPAKSP